MQKGERVLAQSKRTAPRTTTNFKVLKKFSNWYINAFDIVQISIFENWKNPLEH
jgi:hypothetical protein